MLKENRRWAVDDRFERIVAHASKSCGERGEECPNRVALLAVDYAFSIFSRRWANIDIKAFVGACNCRAQFKKIEKRFNLWPALRVLLDFEAVCAKDASLDDLSQSRGALWSDSNDDIVRAIASIMPLSPRVFDRGDSDRSLTDAAVDDLFDSAQPVMQAIGNTAVGTVITLTHANVFRPQVIRLPRGDVTVPAEEGQEEAAPKRKETPGFWGAVVTSYLINVRDICTSSAADPVFEIARDLGDESVDESLRPGFYNLLQTAFNHRAEGAPNDAPLTRHACQHVTPKGGPCPCQNKSKVPAGKDPEQFRFHDFKPSAQLLRDITGPHVSYQTAWHPR